MRKFLISIGIIGIIAGFAFLKANAQGFGLTPPGPQPYQYQPYARYLNNPTIGAENPNVIDSTGFSFWGLGWISIKVIGFVLFSLNYIIGLIGSILFTLAGLFVEIGLYFNATILDTFAVQLGWRIMRDLANLGFTIGIVIVAYATILGFEEYGIKKTLGWLIVAAIIVNFSFPIAGVFIDASNMVTHFFVSKSIGGNPNRGIPTSNSFGSKIGVERWTNSGPHQLALSLANAFGPQRLLVVNEKDFTDFEAIKGGAGMVTMVVAMFFVALFTIIASLGMLAVGAALLYRFVVLSGLIILMPAAVLAWAFSGTKMGKGYWEKWWEEFTCQLIYLPTMMFFIYLSITLVTIHGAIAGSSQLSIADLTSVIEKASGDKATDALALSGGAASKILGVMSKPLEAITEMILLLALLFYGITQSRKFSCAAGGYLVSKVQGVKDWLLSATGPGAREWAARKALNAGSEPDKNLGNQLGGVMSKIPIIRGLVPGMRTFMAGSKQNIEAHTKEAKTLNNTQLTNIIKSPGMYRLSPEKMAGYGAEAAGRGLLGKDVSMADFEPFIAPLKQFGMEKDVMKAAPHLFERFGWDINKFNAFMEKDFKPDDMNNINADALKNKFVVNNLTAAHLKRLEGKGKEGHRKNFITTLNETMTENQALLFMKNAFKRPQDIEDIHHEIFKSGRFVTGLNAGHMDYLHKNPPGAQEQKIILETLYKELAAERAKSENFVFEQDAEKLNNINSLAQKILTTGETTGGWNNAQKNPEIKVAYDKLKKDYESAMPVTPPTPPPTPTPNVLERAGWNVEARKKDIEQLAQGGETRPTVIESAENALKRSEKEYQKITEQMKRQQNKPQ